MKYHHLTATVNEMIANVLVSDDQLAESPELADYFLYGAADITNQGVVDITPELGGIHVLPDVIG